MVKLCIKVLKEGNTLNKLILLSHFVGVKGLIKALCVGGW
jgi:hypothetical protein